MTLTGILMIIILGLIFMLVEVLVIPGIGVVGIIGGLLMCVGVYFAYEIDSVTGHITLGSTALVSVGVLVLSLRSKTWDRIMLKKEVKSRVNVIEEGSIKVGDVGVAITRLNPIGNARINGLLVEVKSFSSFIDEKTELAVTKVEGGSITVKSKE